MAMNSFSLLEIEMLDIPTFSRPFMIALGSIEFTSHRHVRGVVPNYPVIA